MSLAGLVAGYLAARRGFVVALLAGLIGAAVSLTWHYGLISIEHALADRVSTTTMFSWVAGTAVVCGVYGVAGEHLRLVHRRARRSTQPLGDSQPLA
jgi:hypothetical protein